MFINKICLFLFLLIMYCFSVVYAGNKIPTVVQVCVSCHGINGKGKNELGPMLSGHSVQYLELQINHFLTDKRNFPMMKAMATNLLDHPEKKKEALQYFSSKKPTKIKHIMVRGNKSKFTNPYEKIVYQGDWSRLIPACVTCHGSSGMGAGPFPRLAGQHQHYIIQQLEKWQTGRRKGDVLNVMEFIAKRLTKDEIEGISYYFSKRAVK